MIVRFTKARHSDRPHTLTCSRDDGSVTGMPSGEFFVRHDLTHYAVETTLGFDQAFYGLIAGGWEIDSFADREPGTRKSRKLPEEAILAEHIVGALDIDRAQGPISGDEILALVEAQLGSQPSLTAHRIERIRAKRDELLQHWAVLAAGESVELMFP